MASPRSRLVTWSHTHLSFYGRRFWRPHPDLDRAATPALPPGGGRPLCGGRLPLLAAALGCFAQARKPLAWGPSPRNPHVRGRAFARWVRGGRHGVACGGTRRVALRVACGAASRVACGGARRGARRVAGGGASR